MGTRPEEKDPSKRKKQNDFLRPAHSVAVAIPYAIELAERHGVRRHGVQ